MKKNAKEDRISTFKIKMYSDSSLYIYNFQDISDLIQLFFHSQRVDMVEFFQEFESENTSLLKIISENGTLAVAKVTLNEAENQIVVEKWVYYENCKFNKSFLEIDLQQALSVKYPNKSIVYA